MFIPTLMLAYQEYLILKQVTEFYVHTKKKREKRLDKLDLLICAYLRMNSFWKNVQIYVTVVTSQYPLSFNYEASFTFYFEY